MDNAEQRMIQFELSPEEGSSVENERITFINQRKEDERILPESTDAPSTQYLKEPPLNEKYHSSNQNIYTPPRNPPEPCQPEPQRTPPRASKGSTVWEVYNHEAKAVDNEMVKDWTSSLNSMLVFATIFAAVLTAFVIESQKLLQQDSADIMADVLIFYTNNLVNGNHTPYVRPQFEAPGWAVSCRRVTVGGRIRLRSPRAGFSPLSLVKGRQFRFSGVKYWKMGEVIAALPLLLYFSVVLFFAGTIQWMWFIHRKVGLILLGGSILATAFYLASTIIAAIFPSAPFRTPISRLIYGIGHTGFSIYRRLEASLASRLSNGPIYTFDHHQAPSKSRDITIIEQDPRLIAKSLVWLSTHISISPDSHRLLLQFVQTIISLPGDMDLPDLFKEVPWLDIFDVLGSRYLERAWRGERNERTVAHDILASLSRAVQVKPELYPLWRFISNEGEFRAAVRMVAAPAKASPAKNRVNSSLAGILRPFDDLIKQGCDNDQHLVLVELACIEIESTPLERYSDDDITTQVQDPSLRLIACAAGSTRWNEDFPTVNPRGQYWRSWSRASELCTHWPVVEDSSSNSSIWKLRMGLWDRFSPIARIKLMKRTFTEVQILNAMLQVWNRSEEEWLINACRVPDANVPGLTIQGVSRGEQIPFDNVHFILPLILQSDGVPLPSLDTVDMRCSEVIIELCNTVKQDPARLLFLLKELTLESIGLDDDKLWDNYRVVLLITERRIIRRRPPVRQGDPHELGPTMDDSHLRQLVQNIQTLSDRLFTEVDGFPKFPGTEEWKKKTDSIIAGLKKRIPSCGPPCHYRV